MTETPLIYPLVSVFLSLRGIGGRWFGLFNVV